MGLKKGEVSAHDRILQSLQDNGPQSVTQLIASTGAMDPTIRKAVRELVSRGKAHRPGHWLIGDRRHMIYQYGPGEDSGNVRLKVVAGDKKQRQKQYNKSVKAVIREALAATPQTSLIVLQGRPVWSKASGFNEEEIKNLKEPVDSS